MTVETVPDLSIGERMKEAFGGIDMRAALRLTFNKCPTCGTRLDRGSWLRWCPDRSCQFYGVLNRSLGNKVEYIKPRSDEEQRQLQALSAKFRVETS